MEIMLWVILGIVIGVIVAVFAFGLYLVSKMGTMF